MTELVVVEKLEKRFVHHGDTVDVLKGVDLRIDQGEMVCVVGPSGAGKSTLLHLLGTLDLPSKGKISYDGVDVTTLGSSALAAFRNQSIGFVFQFHHLLPEFDALENVMMPGLIRGMSRRSLKGRATELLEEVGLAHRISHRPGELSGGEQQRVALARAIVMQPRVVLADEPTGNLDTVTSDAVHKLFFQLNAKHDTTFLIVTHNRELAALMPRVVKMRDGCIESDTRQESPYRGQTGGGLVGDDEGAPVSAPDGSDPPAVAEPTGGDSTDAGPLDPPESSPTP